jgi:hypothetical protein
MPITGSVAWDGRLLSFKGRDTTEYVTTAADFAKTCGACRRPLPPGAPRSLIVDITQSISPDGGEHLTFTDYVCHRQCSDPALTVQQTPWTREELYPIAARMVLAQKSTTGHTQVVPVLAYTLDQVVSFRENGGEPVSALVSLLLSHGFQLAMSPDYSAILQQARQTPAHCKFTVTPNGLLQLSIAGEILYREQLDPENADDAEWLHRAAHSGQILVISGDNLDIRNTSLDLRTAAKHGTLVIGDVSLTDEGQPKPGSLLLGYGRDAEEEPC